MMKVSIRIKLILVISLLIVVLFSIASYLFINEKKHELADDIYRSSLAFARLTASDIANDYDLYLAQSGFVYFNREISKIFEQNSDVNRVAVISYTGEIVYDSEQDVAKKYNGPGRLIEDGHLMDQLRSENISFLTKEAETIYLKADLANGGDVFVDKNEKILPSIKSGTLVDYFVIPANEKYFVLYGMDYHNLDLRVGHMRERIIYLALFGVMLGMIMSFLMSLQITKPILQLVEEANKIAKGDFKSRVDIRSKDELSFLGMAFNRMAEDLGKSIDARLYQARVTHELELAIKIQEQLVPKDVPQIDGLDIAAGLDPAGEIGGDIYDFLPLENNKMLMYLGDVTGHGVPAGIVSSIANALFYGYAHEPDLTKILTNVNRVLKAKTMQTMFMTLCLMYWDSSEKKFSYSSAGHEQIIHYRAKAADVILEPAGGIALGMMPDIAKHIRIQEVDLQPGDFLVIYSDGIPECWREGKETYGMERFKQKIEGLGNLKTAEEIKDSILEDVRVFAAGYEQMDDITIMVIKKT